MGDLNNKYGHLVDIGTLIEINTACFFPAIDLLNTAQQDGLSSSPQLPELS